MHWYKFDLTGSILICKANRKSEVTGIFKTKPRFFGCVDRDKIGKLRGDPYVTVFNSVARLYSVMQEIAPDLIVNRE